MNPQLAQAKVTQQASEQQSAGKVSAADAKYQDVAGTCATCTHFQGDGQPCAVIVEPVSAGGWCSLYEAGQNGMQDPGTRNDDVDAAAATPAAGAAPPQGM
jgi:hypothetical protein